MTTEDAKIGFGLNASAIGVGPYHCPAPPARRISSAAAAWALGLAAFVSGAGKAKAQELVPYPVAPIGYPHPSRPTARPFHLCDFFLPEDGIPRTYSYYYTPWMNQPRHFPFVGPDGRKYWQSTVRGMPMGMQWAAP